MAYNFSLILCVLSSSLFETAIVYGSGTTFFKHSNNKVNR